MKEPQVLDVINTCEFSDVTIANSLSESGWLNVLSGSALKLYLHFIDLSSKGMILSSNRAALKKDLSFENNTASSAPKELEAFGFIRCVHCSGNGSKIYELNNKIYKLPTHWLTILKKNKYKKFVIAVLSGTVTPEEVENMGIFCTDSTDETIRKTLYPLVLKIYDEFNITMEFLLKDEYLLEDFGLDSNLGKIISDDELDYLAASDEDEVLSSEELGYYQNIEDDKSWQSVLSEKDLKNKYLASIVQQYYFLFGTPSSKDVVDIKKAFKICYPSQIKRALVKVEADKRYQGKVTNFAFILSLLEKGIFGLRDASAKNSGKSKKESKQRVIGLKESNISGKEIKSNIDSKLGSNEIVDFSAIFGRKSSAFKN